MAPPDGEFAYKGLSWDGTFDNVVKDKNYTSVHKPALLSVSSFLYFGFVFNKTIIRHSRLLDMRSAQRASLAIKHLMTGHNGNKTHCFPRGQSLSVLLYLPTQK